MLCQWHAIGTPMGLTSPAEEAGVVGTIGSVHRQGDTLPGKEVSTPPEQRVVDICRVRGEELTFVTFMASSPGVTVALCVAYVRYWQTVRGAHTRANQAAPVQRKRQWYRPKGGWKKRLLE